MEKSINPSKCKSAQDFPFFCLYPSPVPLYKLSFYWNVQSVLPALTFSKRGTDLSLPRKETQLARGPAHGQARSLTIVLLCKTRNSVCPVRTALGEPATTIIFVIMCLPHPHGDPDLQCSGVTCPRPPSCSSNSSSDRGKHTVVLPGSQ